jgi:hypothetical protein
MSVAEEIKRLHELHQAGALSDEEFAAAKARLLNNGPTPGDSADLWRLRRSRSDRWLGGVCGGLARVSGVESWIGACCSCCSSAPLVSVSPSTFCCGSSFQKTN